MKIIVFLIALVLSISSISFSQQSQKRLALVIGISSYVSAPLKNPVNDAVDVAQSLRSVGFEVLLKTNQSFNDMGKAVNEFGEKLKQNDVGLFYYSGHGVSVDGNNYLVPVDANPGSENEVPFTTINAGFVLAKMETGGTKVNIVILDACRDNPFVRSFRSGSRGLAVISKGIEGSVIIYSTDPGSTASDGEGINGVSHQLF